MRAITIAILLAGLLLNSSATFADTYWQDATVTEHGFTTFTNGARYPSATIKVLNPDDSDPLLRCNLWAMMTDQGVGDKSKVDFSIGNHLKVYQVSRSIWQVQVHYTDKKGKEKETKELHWARLLGTCPSE